MKWSSLYNPLMIGLLLSPLHGMVSANFVLLLFNGRKSGKSYSVPVEYCGSGRSLFVFTMMERTWWKNLQGQVEVMVHLRGKTLPATANAISGQPEVFREALHQYLEKYPGRERFFGVRRASDGHLNQEDVIRAAEKRVVIALLLPETAVIRA